METHPGDFYNLMCKIGIRLVVTQETNKHRNKLLFDSRLLPDNLFAKKPSLVCWHFNQDGVLVKKGFNVSDLPKLNAQNLRYKNQIRPLHQLLQAHQPFEDPQSRKDLEKCLKSFAKFKICIQIFYTPKMSIDFVHAINEDENFILISAFTRPNYTFGYRLGKPKRVYAKKEKPEKVKLVQEPSPFDINRRTSVSIQLTGLTQAFLLGAANVNDIFHTLNKTLSSIAIHFDDEMHERVVTYCDKDETRHFVLPCSPPEKMIDCHDPSLLTWINTWMEIFEFIKTRGEVLAKERIIILKPVLDHLEPFSEAKQTSPWSNCLRSLKWYANKHRILVYSPSDVVMHQIKLPFAHFMKTWKKNKFKSVLVKNSVTNNIVALLGGGMEIVNVACYLFKDRGASSSDDLNETANLHGQLFELARDWIGPVEEMEPPLIKHSIKTLKCQPNVGNMMLKTYVEKRGLLIAKSAIGIWEAVASFLQQQFGFDINTVALTSLSSISFKSIWLKYSQLSGPLSHPMEKMTPYNEARIREWSRGGFSYSAKRSINEGDPLFPDGGPPSTSVESFDITSSYGFAASTFHTPRGFGVTFDQGSRSVGQKRWDGLEFKSVMLIVYVWTRLKKMKLRAWYSNFSAFGLVYIAKYPIDLVGIFEDGSIELIQIDGHFIHGHAGGHCKTLPKYKNDMSRQDVEKETLARDAAIHQWIQETDPTRMKYSVFHDCCTPEFNKSSLDKHFENYPELSNLVRPYKTINGHFDENNDDMTFIAIVKGSVPPEKRLDSPGFGGPLVIWKDSDQELAWEGRIILTKDYFIYLRKEFNFQIREIEWAVFYPTCRVLNQVYKHLLELRQSLNPSKASLIKVMVNHSCGFMGLNANKSEPTKCRISTRNHFKAGSPQPDRLANIQDTNYFFIKTFSKKKDHVVACHTPLFMFLSIVEMGKMRLNQIMLFLYRRLKPGFFNIVYINTDSTVLVLATPTLEDAVAASPDLEEFRKGWNNDLASGRPGCMKLEFKVPHQTNWKSITSNLRNYAIICDNPEFDRFKMSSLNDLTPKKAFEISHQQLEQQPVVVQQIRRKNKLQDLTTTTVDYVFKPPKKPKPDPPHSK